jgi:hypothetical protein
MIHLVTSFAMDINSGAGRLSTLARRRRRHVAVLLHFKHHDTTTQRLDRAFPEETRKSAHHNQLALGIVSFETRAGPAI